MEAAENKLQILLDSILDGTATDAELLEFSDLIERQPDLSASFLEQLRTHSLLQWLGDELDDNGACRPASIQSLSQNRRGLAQFAESSEQIVPVPLSALPADRATWKNRTAWFASLAASLLVAAGAIALLYKGPQPQPQPERLAVAQVVDEKGVAWSDNTTALQRGRMIHPGRIETESGALTLKFRSGATVEFRGAASMQIESDMLIRLDRGQATAQVPEWAKGFTIETADVEVIDLGTEFGVVARGDGTTDVVIFEGQVDLKPTGGERPTQRRLNQGEAARVKNDGAIDRIVQVRSDKSGAWSTAEGSEAAPSVLKSIHDNISSSDEHQYYNYYQIHVAGLEDDASAYVDRHPHQWNGLIADGLPEFLRGVDYARTFNDYRYIEELEIIVELAAPADLYVFFDDRVPIPDWLTERFTDTGVNIGLDEGPFEGIPDHRTAIGGGESIDNTFSVWRRRCDRPETVTLGAVGDSSEARAMYGIAAVPLKSE